MPQITKGRAQRHQPPQISAPPLFKMELVCSAHNSNLPNLCSFSGRSPMEGRPLRRMMSSGASTAFVGPPPKEKGGGVCEKAKPSPFPSTLSHLCNAMKDQVRQIVQWLWICRFAIWGDTAPASIFPFLLVFAKMVLMHISVGRHSEWAISPLLSATLEEERIVALIDDNHVHALAVKKYQSLTHSLTDNFKSRNASASKNGKITTLASKIIEMNEMCTLL